MKGIMMWLLFGEVFLGFVCISTLSSGVPECPPREDIYPCRCDTDEYLTSIGCDGISSIDKIQHVMKNTKGLNMSFAFWKSRLGDIPSDFFDGHQSVSLHFENCQIGSFGDRPFTGLEDTVNNIYIYGSVNKRRKDLATFRLSHLKKLEDLSFMGNDIKRLGNDWFESGPASLRMLLLDANDIEELGDRAFANLPNIEQIWLGDSRFKKVSRSMFPRPANKLQLLEISFDEIDELPEDFFEDMPALKDVNVSGNNLKSIPEATWGKIWDQLDEVYLERNKGFKCDDNLKWIYKRKLPRILTGKCTDEKHYGKEIKDLTLADFE